MKGTEILHDRHFHEKNCGENPEVPPQAARRCFTGEHQRRIAVEAESCSEDGEIGALWRRERLYASVVPRWRRQLGEEPLLLSKKTNRWTYYQLYVIVDIYRCCVVGWMLADLESAAFAKQLIESTIENGAVS